MAEQVRLTVWSDYVCPFCYLELPAVEEIRREFGDQVEVRWRAFELRPEPAPTLDPNGKYLRETWAHSVYPMAERVGISLKLPPVQPRSRLALEAAAFAATRGRFDAMHRGLFRAFFEEGRDIGRMNVLREIAAVAGLDPDHLQESLERGHFSAQVRQDAQTASELGVSGVPATLVAPAESGEEAGYLLEGAVPAETLRKTVERVLQGAP